MSSDITIADEYIHVRHLNFLNCPSSSRLCYSFQPGLLEDLILMLFDIKTSTLYQRPIFYLNGPKIDF